MFLKLKEVFRPLNKSKDLLKFELKINYSFIENDQTTASRHKDQRTLCKSVNVTSPVGVYVSLYPWTGAATGSQATLNLVYHSSEIRRFLGLKRPTVTERRN